MTKLLGAMLAGSLATIGAAVAQTYPAQPITLVSPFPPGGSVDITARIIADPLSKALGGSVIVENRTGASRNIGMEAVARAKPDGYTLVLNTVSLATNASLFPKVNYDVVRNFVPIATVAKSQHVLVINPKVDAKNVQELIAMARARPGRLIYASGRRWLHVSHFGGAVQRPNKHIHFAYSLSRRRAGAGRYARRASGNVIPGVVGRVAAYSCRQAARAGGHINQAQ